MVGVPHRSGRRAGSFLFDPFLFGGTRRFTRRCEETLPFDCVVGGMRHPGKIGILMVTGSLDDPLPMGLRRGMIDRSCRQDITLPPSRQCTHSTRPIDP
ncbi:MAG: hypothetical protein D6795_08675 [Deltaproteobacteria bacterium]|nr:MAG: hypothetical protein D6795_08675 [Deltaproteobacteria bacterium]